MTDLDNLISETAALERWKFLSAHKLRLARKSGKLPFTKGKRGAPWYREQDLVAYVKAELENQVGPCQPNDAASKNSRSAVNGSPTIQIDRDSTVVGMTPALEEQLARNSKARIVSSQS